MRDVTTLAGTRPLRLRRDAAVVGLILGALFGVAFVVATGRAGAERHDATSRTVIDATHLPPLLTAAGEDVELRYDVHCASEAESSGDAPCAAGGEVFLRSGMIGAFRRFPLIVDERAVEGSRFMRVPEAIATSPRGFSYYAVFTSDDGSASATLPTGGAESPHRSLPLGSAASVSLGRHEYGRTRGPSARVAQARWGNGATEVGLEGGVNVSPVGGSAFDVLEDGTVFLLDQVHKRVLRFAQGRSAAASSLPVAVDGTIADLAVADDGTMYVLEGARSGRAPALRTIDSHGRTRVVTELAERTATRVEIGADGVLVLQQPSGHWLPVADGESLRAAQARAGKPGRPLPNDDEVVVLRTGNELRVALVHHDAVRRSWRIKSKSSLAEVQLAEPLAAGLLVVVRVYSDAEDEFVALLLDRRGLRSRLSLESADWAESAPLGRFRLRGSSLYQLGSTPSEIFVNRFDLEVE